MKEPFVLYVSKRFMDKASKSFGLGFLVRKPVLEIAKKLNLNFVEIEREEAKNAIERLGESKGITLSKSDLFKSLALAFFLPTGAFVAAMKKIHYRSGIENEDYIFIEFLSEIPRAFKTTLFFDVWLIIPKTETGGEKAVELLRNIVEKVGTTPITDEEWQNLKPIREKLAGKIALSGVAENLWSQFI